MHHSKDVAAAAPANAAGSGSGSFSRLTHAAEFYASQAATQAAGLFSYKTGDEGQERRDDGQCRLISGNFGTCKKDGVCSTMIGPCTPQAYLIT